MDWRAPKVKRKGNLQLEKMKHPFEPRKFSSFHTRDKKDYSGVFAAMGNDKIRK